MESIDAIKQLIQPVLLQNDVKLYGLRWTSEKNNKILEISILKNDGTMDLDTCALISEKVSEVLDDVINIQYMLEVCSPGAEREIHDLNELPYLIGKHVFVRLKHSIKSKIEFTGDIIEVGDVITLSYKDKANIRKIEFLKEDIEFIRLAVNI